MIKSRYVRSRVEWSLGVREVTIVRPFGMRRHRQLQSPPGSQSRRPMRRNLLSHHSSYCGCVRHWVRTTWPRISVRLHGDFIKQLSKQHPFRHFTFQDCPSGGMLSKEAECHPTACLDVKPCSKGQKAARANQADLISRGLLKRSRPTMVDSPVAHQCFRRKSCDLRSEWQE